MVRYSKIKCHCGTDQEFTGSLRIESLVTIDERGQMVLPKEIREKADIRPGDKLVVITFEKGGEVCCISLIKASSFADMAKDMIGPLIGGILKKGGK